MYGADNLNANVPLSWKESFIMGVIIPHKMRNCNKCTKEILCGERD